ncbi:hypothetical protein GCM10020000_75830 [Streptomyces olivoverticillatus]
MTVIANCTAQPYTAENAADLMLEQIDHPVRWRETVESLLALPDPQFTEIGESTILTSMVRQIRRDAKPAQHPRAEAARRCLRPCTYEEKR